MAAQRQRIAAALLADPTRTNVSISIAAETKAHEDTVAKVRARLEASGQIPEVQRVRPNAKPVQQRAGEIAALASKSMTLDQIAAAVGTSSENVSKIAKGAGITIPANIIIGRSRRLNPDRIVEECVTTLGAVARGLGRPKKHNLRLTPAAALDMLHETLDAQRAIRALVERLKEIAHE